VSGVAAMMVAAQFMTLPLVVYSFGRMSLISFAANLLIVPVQPVVMTGGLAALTGGLVWEPLGRVLAVIPWLFLTWTTTVVRLAAAVPFASVDVGATGRMLAGFYYGILLAAMIWREAHNRRWLDLSLGRSAVIIAAVALPVWLVASTLAALPDGRLHITFIPGEKTEAVLIETPAGQRVWLGRGENDEALASAARTLSGGRRMDVAIGDEADALWPDVQVISDMQFPVGASLRLADGVTLTRLDCGEEPILLLAYRDFRALLPVTLTLEEQECLVRAYHPDELRLTLLKTPQPGTGAWPLADLVTAASPQLVIWPEGTTYPPDVDEALARYSALRVPDGAAVEVITDGARMWVEQNWTEG